ncbi:putative erythromycin esterase [Eremomyces bilateralis CBS 781.70]|uniref:Erythromycin esterase n=1 Tax=Eremomyces bilateralis CBS 781.70 TaxID=1392243 RepID=A0A6G1G974_9PEZI|nr:putative erythromycin esterase [Eremomyces bilateralis CBS 781.70]KAF1814645.1 putative erythromycin esterase [Eremomyces bilateralis CBS 781.70]
MSQHVVDAVKAAAQTLPPIDTPEFGQLFDSFGKARVVLIGDASHGTSEFYRARAAITKRLIEKHGFTTVAIEADWPDARSIDRFVRRQPTPAALKDEKIFDHFPRWMWRNVEVQDFIDWLRVHNERLDPPNRTGFYGLDLYSMGASIRAVIDYLDRADPDTAAIARERYGCLLPWVEEPAHYGRAALNKGYAPCEAGVVQMLRDLLAQRMDLAATDPSAFTDAEFNARVVRDAEKYYRSMYYGGAESWNLRDGHMFATLARLLKLNPGSKAVVWAHNSHVGDARHTEMGRKGEHNIGQLVREHFADPTQVAIIGCGTHAGTVAAADDWGMPMRIKTVKESREDSYERVMHATGVPAFLLDLRDTPENAAVRQALGQQRRERFIGVIYRPQTELGSHYAKAILPKQMDALVWFDRTKAVEAFETAQPRGDLSMEETYPFGL